MPINSFLYPGPTNSNPYQVANSCRFAGDAYGQKSISSSGSGTTATFSAWAKPSSLPDFVLFTSHVDTNNYVEIYFNSGQFRVYHYDGGSTSNDIQTNSYYRDQSAWYHFHVIFDTANGTEADRVQMSVNGTRVTSFKTANYPTSSQDLELNSSSATFNLGARNADEQWKGYMAEVVWLDGTASAVTNFGEFDEDSPTIWKPKDVSGLSSSKGTNGFYCDFEDSSNLGNDVWGGTDFTETNLAATDQATDTPTNNFATFNPLENYYQSNTYSEGNCQVQTQNTSFTYNFATIGVSAGKWYWEIEYDAKSGGTDQPGIGITSTQPTANDHELGNFANDWGWYTDNGTGYQSNNNSYSNISINSYTVGDIIGVALDLTNNKLYFRKNGTWEKSGDPTSGSTGTGAISITAPASTPLGAYFPSVADHTNSQNATFKANFGGCSAFTISSGNADANGYGNFEYSVPSGYYSLCTKNLAEFG